jgi:type II secretory pathway pseudopilin PulG
VVVLIGGKMTRLKKNIIILFLFVISAALFAENLSIGVNTLFRLNPIIGIDGKEYDINSKFVQRFMSTPLVFPLENPYEQKELSVSFDLSLVDELEYAGCSDCSGCISKADRELIAAEEQARMDEEARLAADGIPQSKEAQLAEEARIAAKEAQLAAQRAQLAAQRAQDAAQRAQDAAAAVAEADASQAPRPTTYPSETNASIPLVGTWANNNKNIILQVKANGTITIHEYSITDQTVDVKFEANRGLTGGGYYKRINPADVQSSYKGTGTYTITKDVIDIKLSLKNEFGTTKDVSLSGKFSLDANKTNLRLEHGFAGKFIYNRENSKVIDTSEFVSDFFRL